MNFFEQQDQAKRNTTRLILLLVLAVCSLIAITTLLFAFFFYYLRENSTGHLYEQNTSGLWAGLLQSVPLETLGWVSLAICTVVLLGSGYKYLQLQSGGRAVAQAMGGHLLLGNTQDGDERKILNVVEEMAIASGTSVPSVYVIEDQAINAFAAGFTPQNAVIGITRGCIQLLNRDELQGVIAHEFSHIFHGDMRINMRLVAILHGILLLGLIGEFLLYSNSRRGMISSNKKNSQGAIMGFGLGLIVVGYAGTFFGNLIKSAVSRQREFLADASAVQFTRNPAGISGALQKIGAHSQGSKLSNNHAAEFSHMYFGQGISSVFQLMATHPPLATRIKRIDPRWDGSFPEIKIDSYIKEEGLSADTNAAQQKAKQDAALAITTAATVLAGSVGNYSAQTTPYQNATALASENITEDQLVDSVATPTHAHLEYARARLEEITPELKLAAQQPLKARALAWGLLLDRSTEAQTHQLKLLEQKLGSMEFEASTEIMTAAANAADKLRLPLIELAIPSLKTLAPAVLTQFLQCVQLLIRADDKISLSEWAIYSILLHNTTKPERHSRHKKLHSLQSESHLLVSLLAQAGADNSAAATQAFAQAQSILQFENTKILAKRDISLVQLDKALIQLNQLAPLQKPKLLKALGTCVIADGKITLAEAELLRAIADCLDCPMPPLLTANDTATRS